MKFLLLFELFDVIWEFMVKFLSKLSVVSLWGIGSFSIDVSVSDVYGNFVFEGIGDEDL